MFESDYIDVKKTEFFVIIIVSLFVAALVGTWSGVMLQTKTFQKEAIQHKAAYYHPETGVFTWKTLETK
jgi:hypothetical protein